MCIFLLLMGKFHLSKILNRYHMRFVTLFPDTKNVHLLKDVGMIPYMLHQLYKVDSYIALYQSNEEYPYLQNEVKGLKLEFIKKYKAGKIISGLLYLLHKGKTIDILNIYHLNLASFVWGGLFHKINRRGKIYLKLDMDIKGFHAVFQKNLVGFIKRQTIRQSDFVSVESRNMQKQLEEQLHRRIFYIPNGYFFGKEIHENIVKQHNLLTVGALGTYVKATDILLEAFATSADAHDWSLILVGRVECEFQSYIKDFFKKYPLLKNRIRFEGQIEERNRLLEIYASSGIFLLPSRSESFGIALVEAASQGCYLITTNKVASAIDITNHEKYGKIVKADDVKEMKDAILESVRLLEEYPEISKTVRAYASKEFKWEEITKRIWEIIEN